MTSTDIFTHVFPGGLLWYTFDLLMSKVTVAGAVVPWGRVGLVFNLLFDREHGRVDGVLFGGCNMRARS